MTRLKRSVLPVVREAEQFPGSLGQALFILNATDGRKAQDRCRAAAAFGSEGG